MLDASEIVYEIRREGHVIDSTNIGDVGYMIDDPIDTGPPGVDDAGVDEYSHDATGAGDSFAGGFIGYLAKTKDISFSNMKRAIIYGSAMASFTVERFGTERLLGLSSKDVEERIQEFIDLVQFDIELV